MELDGGEEGGEILMGMVEGRVDLEEMGWIGGGWKLFCHEGGLFKRENEV